MPYKEKTNFKYFYKIGEIADIVELSTTKIRYYTNIFDLKLARTRNNDRIYMEKDINKFKFIIYLLYVEKFRLDGAVKKFKKFKTLDNYIKIFENND